MNRQQKHQLAVVSIFLYFLSSCASADSGFCDESKGYIEKDGLVRVVDIDCSEDISENLCGVILAAPDDAYSRKIKAFTFAKFNDGEVEIYLNLQMERTENEVKTSFDVAKNILPFVRVQAVYENINGCTLRSEWRGKRKKGDASIFE